MSKIEVLECRLTVLLDLLRRSLWYLGKDKQSSPPTKKETTEFAKEVRAVLEGD